MYNITHNFQGRSVVATPKVMAEIDQLYVFRTRFKCDLRQKQQPEYKYMNHGIPETAPEGEIFTYMQTFEVDGVNVGLTLVTKEHRKSYIAKFFKQSIKEIKANKSAQAKACKARPKMIGLSYFA